MLVHRREILQLMGRFEPEEVSKPTFHWSHTDPTLQRCTYYTIMKFYALGCAITPEKHAIYGTFRRDDASAGRENAVF